MITTATIGTTIVPRFKPRPWPTREEWQREPFTYHVEVPNDLALYATPEEVQAAAVALREEWKRLGRLMHAGQTHEHDTYRGLECRDIRWRINSTIAKLKPGEVPLLESHVWDGSFPAVAAIVQRYEDRRIQLHEEAKAEHRAIRQTEEAWQSELRHRAELESYWGVKP